ncbi:MAG: UDP-phosphate N-acetylglucosaminyl 1-phosphate transferase, partial [Minicystis sp.]
VLAWLREEPAPSLDEVAVRLARLSPRAAPTEADAVLQAKDDVKQLYRSLHDQGLIAQRDFSALVRFARAEAGALEMSRDLRPKNAYNLVRLIGTAIHWLRTGEPALEATGPFRDLLFAIKRGQLSLDETLREAGLRARDLEAARQASPLPRHADVGRADTLLRRIGEELARRHLTGGPGPFGKDAAPCPALSFDDNDDDDEEEEEEEGEEIA